VASKYDVLISKLWPGDQQSLAIARDFVAKFGDMPDVNVEALIREAGRIDAAIGAGEMTRDEGVALFSKDTFIETGMKPHIATAIAAWAEETTANLTAADTPPAEPDSADADKPAESTPTPVPVKPLSSPAGTYKPLADAPAKETSADRIIEIEQKYMRAAQGTPEWREYWKGPAMQEEYRGLLSAREAADAAPEADALGAAGRSPVTGPGPPKSRTCCGRTITTSTSEYRTYSAIIFVLKLEHGGRRLRRGHAQEFVC
jgi:hypothetical protein